MMSIAYDYAAPAPAIAAAKPRLLLIDGQHVPSISGRTFKTLNPATEQVIAALWEVDDAAATKLMNHMYGQIRRGSDPAVALRDAKRALIHSGTSQQTPRYWAPFVIYAGS